MFLVYLTLSWKKNRFKGKQKILTEKLVIKYYQLFNKTKPENFRFASAKYKFQLVTKSNYLACQAFGGYDIKHLRVFKNYKHRETH